MTRAFEIDALSFAVAPGYSGDELILEIDGRPLWAKLETLDHSPSAFELVYEASGGEQREGLTLIRNGDRVHIRFRGRSYDVNAVEPLARARGEARAREGKETLLAPMPGIVIELLAAEGDIVAAGDAVLVIESMKLQTQILAELGGRIVDLPYAEGASFEQGTVLARIESVRTEEP